MSKRLAMMLALLPLVAGSMACGNQGDPGSDLTGSWRLVRLEKGSAAPVEVEASDRFTASFGSDGRVSLRADCNVCNAGYTAAAGGLDVDVMACTRAYCSSAPLDTDFAGLVAAASTFDVDGSRLTLSSADGAVHLER